MALNPSTHFNMKLQVGRCLAKNLAKIQGVGRPLLNPHKIVWALQLASTCAIEGGMMIGMDVCRRIAPVEACDEARKLAA
jgi:hypothetical protein